MNWQSLIVIPVALALLGGLVLRQCGSEDAESHSPPSSPLSKARPQKPSTDEAQEPPNNRHPDSRSETKEGAEVPPTLKEPFWKNINHLMQLVDEEGADILLYSEGKEQIEFIEKHKDRFREEIKKICLERGGNLDPLSSRLRSVLSKEEREEIIKRNLEKLEALLAPYKTDRLTRSHIMLEIIGNANQPIGLRADALVWFSVQPETKDVLLGQALSLLNEVREPLLRTKLYNLFLVGGEDRNMVTESAVEKAIGAIENSTEPRGTTVEIITGMPVFFCDSAFKEFRQTHQLRIETALLSRLNTEATKEVPDEAVLNSISYAMMTRRTIPLSSQILEAEKILRSDAAPSVRIAAASFLLPEVELAEWEDHGQDLAALQGYLTQMGNLLVDVLRNEKDKSVIDNIMFGLMRCKDPQLKEQLLSLANERPDLREQIERRYLPKK